MSNTSRPGADSDGDSRAWHDGWDRVVNRGSHDSLICYCGEEVACYHAECLAMRPVNEADDIDGKDGGA